MSLTAPSMSFALLFSGQGTQHAGMLRWLRQHPLVQATNAALGMNDWRDAFRGADGAMRNDVAQVMLTGIMLAAWAQLAPALPVPSAVAGYSVGELAAFSAAGVFEAPAAIALARERAEAMDRCAALAPGGLLAVTGLPMSRIDACLGASHLQGALSLAIRNAPFLFVLGGAERSVTEAMTQLQACGARCTRLGVPVASHTPSMRRASDDFAAVLRARELQAPRVPLFSGTRDRIFGGGAAASALAEQLSSTLRWDDCLENIHARRVDCVLEIGPGTALASMWNQRFPGTPARSVDEFEDGDAIVAWVKRQA